MSLPQPLFSPKNLAWYMWDFGTQLLLVNVSIYFSEWLILDNKVPDFWYSFTFILSTVILIFLSPYVGVFLDRKGSRRKFFFATTALTLLSGVFIQLVAGTESFIIRISLALVLFALLNIFYQLAFIAFNTFLKDISSDQNVGTVAGIAGSFSTMGDALGLLLGLPIILGVVTLFGTSRVSMFIPLALLGGLSSLPMYFAFRKHQDDPHTSFRAANTYRQIWEDLKDTRSYPGVARLLLAYCFYNDAILTMQLFAAIYLEKVHHIPDSEKVIIIIIVYLAFALGAWLGGRWGDKRGNQKALLTGLLLTALTTLSIAFINPTEEVYALFAVFGIGAGITAANTKALFAKLIPYEKKAQFFSIYSIFEKVASIIGPATWGLVVYFVSSTGNLNYRVAVVCMSGFLFLGAFVARKVKESYAL